MLKCPNLNYTFWINVSHHPILIYSICPKNLDPQRQPLLSLFVPQIVYFRTLYKWTHTVSIFCIQFLSLNIVFLKFGHGVAHQCFVPFVAEWHFTMWIYQFVDGLSILNKSMNIFIQVFGRIVHVHLILVRTLGG